MRASESCIDALCTDLRSFAHEGETQYGHRSVAAFQRNWLYARVLIAVSQAHTRWPLRAEIDAALAKVCFSFGGSKVQAVPSLLKCTTGLELIDPVFPQNYAAYLKAAETEHRRTLELTAAALALAKMPEEYAFIVTASGSVLVHPHPLDVDDTLLQRGRKHGRIVHPMFAAPMECLRVQAAGEVSFCGRRDGSFVYFVTSCSGHYRPARLLAMELACAVGKATTNSKDDFVVVASDGLVVTSGLYKRCEAQHES